MGFSSQIMPGELIINDSTPEYVTQEPPDQSRGLKFPRRMPSIEERAATSEFPREMIIPRSEWQARIQELEQTKTRLSDIANRNGLPCKDQGQTNFCWINAPAYSMELLRLAQGQKMVLLSAASGGAVIKGFRNVGGWGQEALEFIAERGLVPQSLWPENRISREYSTDANWAVAKKYRCLEWWALRPRNDDELMSALFHRWPVAVGYNWWSHEVTAVDPVWVDGTYAIRIRNSWSMNWPTQGAAGYGILQGRKLSADDAVIPKLARAV
jgi:hypothetical protein